MRKWLDRCGPWIAIWVVATLIIVTIICVASTLDNRQICKDAGYVDRGAINGQYVCFGYTEDNQMIVESFENVKERAGRQ